MDICHIASKDNMVADTLSCLLPLLDRQVNTVSANPLALDYTTITVAQRVCPSSETAKQTWALTLFFQVRSPLIFYPWIAIALSLI